MGAVVSLNFCVVAFSLLGLTRGSPPGRACGCAARWNKVRHLASFGRWSEWEVRTLEFLPEFCSNRWPSENPLPGGVACSDSGRGAPGWVLGHEHPPRSLRLPPLPGGDLTCMARTLEPAVPCSFGEKTLIRVQNSSSTFFGAGGRPHHNPKQR